MSRLSRWWDRIRAEIRQWIEDQLPQTPPNPPPAPGDGDPGPSPPPPVVTPPPVEQGVIYPPPHPETKFSQVPPPGAVRSETMLLKLSLNDNGTLRGIAALLASSLHGKIRSVTLGGKPMVYAPWSKKEGTNGYRPTYRINGEILAPYVGTRLQVTLRDGTTKTSKPIAHPERNDYLQWD